MTLEDLRQELLAAAPIREALLELQTRFVADDLPAFRRDGSAALDWNRLLLLASVLAGGATEESASAALRITQGCFISPEVSEAHRVAAAVVLERMGNRGSVELAEKRDLLTDDRQPLTPVPLQLDVMRRRLELSIPGRDGTRRPVSPFQRRFWDLATRNDWLSVSAPTSAGKSWIVMRWFEHRMFEAAEFRGVYVVPTRALVEEVALALTDAMPDDIAIHTIPWDADINESARELYVMTQERVHLLLHRLPDLVADVVFVDEAQKFADDSRGVLLQRALADLVRRDSQTQVILASPMSSNPELLIRDAPEQARTHAEVAETVTVNQTLLWADAVKGRPKQWRLRAPDDTTEREIGTFEVEVKPSRTSQRLPVAAYSLARDTAGNVVYVNGAADAEKAALQISELLGSDVESDVVDLRSLIELVTDSVHPQYALTQTLRRGVAFHYGNMPLIVRAEIERLFRDGTLRYLICTSTLLEGVNLPCRNLFARGPRRGKGKHMTAADFWNLAGRAGRWGKEFQGNIICVDASNVQEWPIPPRTRSRAVLRRATDDELLDLSRLVEHARAGAPVLTDDRAQDLSEAMMSLLAVSIARDESLDSLGDLGDAPPETVAELRQLLRKPIDDHEIPTEVLERHAGISPFAMGRLLNHFGSVDDVADLLVDEPAGQDALSTYKNALAHCATYLGAPFGEDKRQWQLAYLITDWMRGRPLAYLIRTRIRLNTQSAKPKRVAALIRETMADVETVARFQAPKFLACYLDLLRTHLVRLGEPELAAEAPNLDMLLELGVSQPTQMVLLSLGLSRTTTIAVTEYLLGDNLS
ncbi:MAG TPA: DEAD/DEAH box helicase, partial [Polyangiales bacterium]